MVDGCDNGNVECAQYNDDDDDNNNTSCTGESLRMGESSLGKSKTTVCPFRLSSLGNAGEVPEGSARQ
jgi:hypothetical protein